VKGVGRFWYFYSGGDFTTGTNVEHTAIDSYDAVGRPLMQRQLFKVNGTWGPTYQTSRTYNRAGAVVSQTYPSGHTVSYTYDAAGRTATFSGYLGDGTQRAYATGITYSSWGSIGREQFGTTTPLYHKTFYNIRGQLFDTRVSSVNDTWDWNRGRLILYYSSNHLWGQSGTDNSGNVRFAETWIPPENATLDQTDTLIEDSYNYDTLNRLTNISEQRMSVAGGWGNWQQQFRQQYAYDRYGNRTIDAAQTWGVGINNKQFTVDPTSNRLGVPTGQTGVMSYDPAGNLTTDTYTGVGLRTYDAENRMLTAADNTGQISRYTYDADGRRVRVQVASSQEKWHVYGFDGELLAEYPTSSPVTAPEKEYGYRNGQLLVTATGRFNVALAANGAVATASSSHTCCGFSTTGAINGNNRGPWGNGEGWNDATANTVPDWIQVDFAGIKTIDEIDVFSLHDNYTTENTPTETQTFTLYGLLAFDVQYWNGSSWTTVPGGSVSGNNKVWRKFTFAPITTSKIRVWINAVPDSWSRVVEIQAFGTSAGDKIQWLVSDQLGTPRMIVDQTGALANMKRHDYLPFGEELFAPSGGRTAGQGYVSGDGIRQQFTLKERDNETGLDYSINRYYGSVQGRFTSPDPTLLSIRRTNPQTLNRYSYVLNNPVLFIDPLGLWELEYDPVYENGRTDKVKTIKIHFRKSKDGDNADSLLKQLGFKSKDKGYAAMRSQIEAAMKNMGDLGIEASTLKGSVAGIDIGSTFNKIGNLLGTQANYDVEQHGRNPQNPGPTNIGFRDCTMTTARISFGASFADLGSLGTQDGPTGIDERFLSSARQAEAGDLRLLDAVRYGGNGNSVNRHYMSVVFTGDDGQSQAFSRSGVSGRFQIVPVNEFAQPGSKYGSISGAGNNRTGFYRP
jgi:RHS repeat-associated protein